MTKLLRSYLTASVCLFALFTSTAPAGAQSAKKENTSDETATSMARERFKEGVQYFDQKQYDRARVAFMQAYALKRHPAVLLNLAQSELRSGHEADAAKHFSMFLREARDATPAEREGAEAGLFAAKAVCGEIAVKVDTEGAVVFVDGNEEGITPLADPVYVTPGNHQIEVRKDGKSNRASVTAKAGEASEVSLRLAGASSSAPAASEPSEAGDSSLPAEYDSSSAGAGREGFFPWFGHTPLAWVGGGLTVLGIAGGVGFGLSSKQKYDDADAVAEDIRSAAAKDLVPTSGICVDPAQVLAGSPNYMGTDAQTRADLDERTGDYNQACADHQDDIKSGDTMKTLSIVSWAVAGAAAAGTIIYYFADAETEGATSGARQRAPRIGAVVGPGFVGLKGDF
jgi:tetratricopeptide (TPR) repeat protein